MAKTIKIQKDDRVLEVSEKVFNVVYSNYGYVKVEEPPKGDKDPSGEQDLYLLSEDELKKITKDDIKAFLDKEQVPYLASANKDELINIILEK